MWSAGSVTSFFPALSADERRQLLEEKELTNYYRDDVQLRYPPELPAWDTAAKQLRQLKPSVGVEVLFYYPPPQRYNNDPDFRLDVYNVLRSISSMEGIEYYSASRERMRTFYYESYVVSGPDDGTRIEDPTVETIPEESIIHVFQHDSSFGRNVYRATYRYQEGAYLLSLVNLTRMYYGIFPVVAPRNVEIHLAVVLTDQGIVFYGNCGVDVITLLGLGHRVEESFYNRLVALYDWFRNEIGEMDKHGS